VKKNFFVGLNMDYNYTKGTDAAPPVAADSIFRYYEDKPMNSGLGLILRYDSRDVPVDAWKGVLVDVRGTFYSTALGGDNDYQIWQIDYRQYATIGQEGQVLAWQIKTRIGVGDVPYGEMSQLGTPFDLRGYMWGRYRDNNMFFFLMEYRHAFIRDDGTRSPHGVVGWLGSGTVFNEDNFSGKTNNLSWLPNFGVGYRWEVQPRMTLRLDFGIGRESSGIYFNFNQAF
jgi:outer membrane protein assembly factor BamA